MGKEPELDINVISAMVQSLSLETDDLALQAASGTVTKFVNSEAHVEELLRVLYIRILLDWHAAKLMARLCTKIVQIPEYGLKFRTSLLRRIQSDFKSKCFIKLSSSLSRLVFKV